MTITQTADSTASATRRMAASGRPLVEVRDLVKYYPILSGILRRKIGDVRAVDGVSFQVGRKEILGLVGESGCGKSTLGRTLLRLQPQTSGEAFIDGEPIFEKTGAELKRLRRRMQIVFQDPVASLNPRMPVSDIIGEGLLAQADRENNWGKRKIRDDRVGQFLEYVGLRRDYARRFPHEFSGGQRQRIGIARALALDPDFIVCDEPVSALDVSIQSQILNLLIDLRREFGLTYLFIAHNLSVVQYISDRVGVMYLGKIMELAPVERLYAAPRHPYTVALLSAVPEPDPRRRKKRIVLRGDVPSPANPPSGCRFRTRCWLFEQLGRPENCVEVEPPLVDQGGGQSAACHWTDKITTDSIARAAQTAAPVSSADAGSAVADDDSDAPVIPPPAETPGTEDRPRI